MSQYKVYIVDGENSVELDVESVDFTTVFSTADYSDITKRKDLITKSVDFKGSPNNNLAFGSLFHMNRVTDPTLTNKLLFNYDPIQTVDCLIYEDNILLFQGSLMVQKVSVNKGIITYSTVITGKIINFIQSLGDLYLTDLDFTDLSHHYTWNTIEKSWDTSLEVYDKASNAFSTKPFSSGTGYVYPYIDYGNTFLKNDYNGNRNIKLMHLNNLRPAIYVKEYLDRMCKQAGVGYTYEVKGNPDFIKRFNTLIVPNNQETLTVKDQLSNFTISKTTSQTKNLDIEHFSGGGSNYEIPLTLQTGLNADTTKNLINYYGAYRGNTQIVFSVDRTFSGSVSVKAVFSSMQNTTDSPMRINVQLCQRDWIGNTFTHWADTQINPDFSKDDWWEVLGSSFIKMAPQQTLTNQTVFFNIGDRLYERKKQLYLRIYIDEATLFRSVWPNAFQFTMTSAVVNFPNDTAYGYLTKDVMQGDQFMPEPPAEIKQLDFLKSIITMFNLYVYSDPTDPKHLIFEPYDDYYQFAQPGLMQKNSIDWTSKVNFDQFTIAPNLTLPKQYTFAMASDSDFFNKDYTANTTQVYGQFIFKDSLGITEEQKVDVIFAPSPTVEYPSTGRIHAAIYSAESGSVKPVKSTIRLLHYNGLKTCASLIVSDDIISNGVEDKSDIATINSYPNACSYYIPGDANSMNGTHDLNWARPLYGYSPIAGTFQGIPLYNAYYINQISELTSGNLSYVECDAWLNHFDIANLDLSTPVFIDLGPLGNIYFKVIEVSYVSNNKTAHLKLQRIIA